MIRRRTCATCSIASASIQSIEFDELLAWNVVDELSRNRESPALLDERGHSVTPALGAPDKNLASSPVDILELKSAQLAVANACGGEQQQDGSIAKVDRRRRADRIDGVANIIPRKPGRQMGQTPMGRPWNDGGQILLVVASPMQKAEKRSDVRGRRRASGGGRRER